MSRFDDIARFTGFDEDDRAALRALLPIVKPELRSIVDRFYDRIVEDPEARTVLRGEAQVSRLKLTLSGWLERLLGGPWDDEYYRLRSRIGAVHIEVALPQRYMLTAMSSVRVDLHQIVERAYLDSPGPRGAAHRALGRILDIDLAIILDSYRSDSLAAVRRLEEIERRLIARELEISEERCRAILEAAEILAVIVAADGRITMFNRQAELLSGSSRTEILTEEELRRLCHPSDRGALASAIEAVRSSPGSRIAELRLVGRDGQSRWIRWHIGQLPSIDQAVDVCLVGVDLTAERSLAERTRRAETLATLGTLAAGLAHEIRNPLNAAQLQLTLAERRISRDNGREQTLGSINIVRGELGRLATLVGDFLEFARPAPLRLQPCNLVDIAADVFELLETVASEAGVSLRLEAPEAVAVHCDEYRMHQVLLNLVRNAIEAAGTGGDAQILVERRGPSAVLEVSDSGEGLPEDLEIFVPFATSKDRGTGLGLSIVKRIVSDHGGSISTDRAGGRTIFSIEIPVEGPG